MTAPITQPVTMAKALNEGLRKAMEADDKVVIMGEDVGKLGGVFRITDGLQKDFGEHRVIDTPLAESAIIGTAVGLAIRGYRPVCEIQFDGFVFPGFDQIVSQVAKFHNRSAGLVKMPITIRIPSGGGIGAVEHHSESVETYFAHTAGLKVVACSNPSDAYLLSAFWSSVFIAVTKMPFDRASSISGSNASSPGWPITAMPSGLVATASLNWVIILLGSQSDHW